MSYEDVVEGLVERLETIVSLKSVLPYTPTAIHDWPMAYLLFNRGQYILAAQSTNRYFVTVRVVVGWQDWGVAEEQIMPYVDEVPEAIHADPQLGGRLTSGIAMVTEAEGGWASIGNVESRVIDFEVNVKRNL